MRTSRHENRLGVAIDWGTTGITITIGAYTLRYDSNGKLTAIDTQESQYHAVPLAPTGDDTTTLETVWCIRRHPGRGNVEVLVGPAARRAARMPGGPPLLRYPKFLLLDQARIRKFTGRDGRKMGARIITSEVAKSLVELAKFEYTPTDLVAHIVKNLWDSHVCHTLLEQFSAGNTTKYPPKTKFVEVTITRPSIWQLDDDYKLLNAFKQGLTHESRIVDIRLADEAHSAVTGILFDRSVSDEIQAGQVFGLADIGGGTGDLAMHKVLSMTPLRLEEAVPATGAFVGCDILVAQFENDIDETLRDLHVAAHHPWKKALNELVIDFKKQVRSYEGRPELEEIDESGIEIESSAANWKPLDSTAAHALLEKGYVLADGLVQIVHWKVAKLFEPYVTKIAELIVTQIQATKALLRKRVALFYLVGGFFHNCYLQKSCQAELAKAITYTKFRCPTSYPRSVVPRGALRSLADRNINATRTLQVSVGLMQDIVWEGIHPRERKPHMRIGEEEGVRVAFDLVRWVFTKGMRISGPTTHKIRGRRWLQPLNHTCKVIEPLVTSIVRRKNAEISLEGSEHGLHGVSTYVVLADKKNRVERLLQIETGEFDPCQLPVFKTNPKLHLKAGHVKVWYEIQATWDGDVFTYWLIIPEAGHFDCSDPAEPGQRCPGARDPRLCPGQGRRKILECKQSLAPAFGVSGTVERIDDANEDSDDSDGQFSALSSDNDKSSDSSNASDSSYSHPRKFLKSSSSRSGNFRGRGRMARYG